MTKHKFLVLTNECASTEDFKTNVRTPILVFVELVSERKWKHSKSVIVVVLKCVANGGWLPLPLNVRVAPEIKCDCCHWGDCPPYMSMWFQNFRGIIAMGRLSVPKFP